MTLKIHDDCSYRPRGLFGEAYALEVQASDTIQHVKDRISDLMGIPAEEQTLVFEGEMTTNLKLDMTDKLRWWQFLKAPVKRIALEDNRSLKDYEIPHLATLKLVDTHNQPQPKPPPAAPSVAAESSVEPTPEVAA
eukprot:CAMPEP_0118923036 /NCGR_PEP_ID=MMETSP1169-20130426/1720_1 /TAXON_ID=36882 /ORGANISM="Pyramimonas obovata, Strain CCMP722" /LENGTH=135 /DNA_ID=CAMNT_0006863969 /DNA_START=140 /DNA_END=547 /DNA_ORIENTATION=+